MPNPESCENELILRKVPLGNGISINFVCKGERTDVPVIFLHGYVDSWRSFMGVLSEFPAGHQAIAIDLRGHGDSDKPASGYRITDFSGDLVLFMDAMGLEKVNMVGHSMGSFIAQLFAARHPQLVGRLILISSAPSASGNALLRDIKPQVDKLQDPIDRNFIAEFQAPSNPVPEEFMETIISESMKVPAHIWKAALAGLLEVDHRPILRNITASTLIVWGNQDGIFGRRDQEALLSEIRNSRLKEYDAGHALHWERPKELAADLAEFLNH
jgi:non-heme chloroperoxidase